MLYLQLFLCFAKIGLFGFGGGLAILSLIQHEVEANGWMTQSEFVDIVAVSQVTPGPIGINCATYVGYTATGSVLGSIVATFAIILPSLVIMLAICKMYFFLSTRFRQNPYYQNTLRMLRFAVLGLIAAAALLLIVPDPLSALRAAAEGATSAQATGASSAQSAGASSASFIGWSSWVFFAAVFFFTILPQLTARWTKPRPALQRVVRILSHPILLIILAGVAGYLVY